MDRMTDRTGNEEGAIPQQIRDNAPEPIVTITRIELPFRTIFKVILTLAILWFLWTINGILLQLFVAALLAAAMYPPIQWMVRRGVPKVIAVILVVLAVLLVLAGAIFIIAQPLYDQGSQLIDDLPTYLDRLQAYFRTNQDLYDQLNSAVSSGSSSPSTLFNGVLSVGRGTVSAISTTFIVLILAVYILLEGGRMMRWLTSDLTWSHRDRVFRLIPELVKVVSGYIIGQLITSAAFGVFCFITLTIADVPQPLLLALLAAFADAIPIVGVPIATIPAVLLGLTVSWEVAVIVLVAYLIYQQFENYVLVPRVYQGTLQISSFAVLLAVLVGTTLLGVLGALLALPVAAAIPVITRVWLGQEIPNTIAQATGDITQGGDISQASEDKVKGVGDGRRPLLGGRSRRQR